MYRFTIMTACVVLCLGCAPESEPANDGDVVDVSSPFGEAMPALAIEFGIGDVESNIQFVVTLTESMDRSTVRYVEIETKKYELARAELIVPKPYPETLVIDGVFRSFDNFFGHAVQVKPSFYIDDREIPVDPFVFPKLAASERPRISINLMEHFDEIPQTVLVHARAELNLFLDTDADTIGPDTPVTESVQTVVKMSNPVRVTFEQ